MDILNIIGRNKELFSTDIATFSNDIDETVRSSAFLVIGAAGSIGKAVTKEIFQRNPKKLHAVDINENNLAELVRDIRSTYGYIDGDFRTFALDCGSLIFDAFFSAENSYDYILNLSALKHVRSEKDPYTLMRMIEVNILNTIKTIDMGIQKGIKKYFCVSTDKAANPVNMMGASKRIMEQFLLSESRRTTISTARFANVAFSDGSLLHGFNQRIALRQPIAAPNDVRRYFLTPKESGQLCLMSTILGDNRDIFFPKLNEKLHLISFSEIAQKFLESNGFEVYECTDEEEARSKSGELIKNKKWPCVFSGSNTTGEKDFEEFYTENEVLDMTRFMDLGIVKNDGPVLDEMLNMFLEKIHNLRKAKVWDKKDLVSLFNQLIPEFNHLETGVYLDSKM